MCRDVCAHKRGKLSSRVKAFLRTQSAAKMPRRSAYRLCTSVLLFALVASLGSARADNKEEAVRAEFARVYSVAALSKPSFDSAALRNYILYPYIQKQRLLHALAAPEAKSGAAETELDQEVDTFIKAHDRETVSAELRRNWYASLAQRQQWERLIAAYRDVNDPTLHCHLLSARVALQRTDGLQSLVATAWSNAADSRPACESAFTWLKSQSVYTPELIEARARQVLLTGNAAFARQIIAMLPATSKPMAESLLRWATLIERPRAAMDAAIASPLTVIEPAALLDGWTRLARADANAAMQRYDALVRARDLPKDVASRFALELALSLSWSRRRESLTYFAKVGDAEFDERGEEWYARAALWASNWSLAARRIEVMSPALRQQTKWGYWAARVAELRGQSESARTQYAALLRDDNYYAALAAARAGQPYTPNPEFFPVDDQVLQRTAALPDMQRARELLSMENSELRAFAYDEWRYGFSKLNPAARAQAVILASRWNWHDQAILTASQQSFFDDYSLLYPRPYDTQIKRAAEIVELPPTLLYAVLRQESLYRVDAVSSAGARGLMQLLPSTAAYTAQRRPELTKLLREPNNLSNPTTNIYLGAAKLRDMIDRFDGKVPMALAAYNAGPTAARRWHPTEKKDLDVWIENIPYNETRIYIQRIYWHSVVFGWLLTGEAQDTKSWLTTIGPLSSR
jgi:soluble lytic murein transglycosylase